VPAKTIIALTDGNDTASQVPPLEAARVAQPRDIRIHTVAIGDPATVGENKLDEASLRATAAATGGKYFFAADRDALAGIYDELDRIETRKVEVISHRPRIELFPALVLAALVLALLDKLVLVLRQWRGHAAAVRDDGGRVRVDAFSGRLEVVPAGAVARQAARRAETVS
jgi:Ca-activated chloride channel family protein